MPFRELTRDVRDVRGTWFAPECPDDVVYLDALGIPGWVGFGEMKRVRLTPAELLRRGRESQGGPTRRFYLINDAWFDLEVQGDEWVTPLGVLLRIGEADAPFVGYARVADAFEAEEGAPRVRYEPGLFGLRVERAGVVYYAEFRAEQVEPETRVEWQSYRGDDDPIDFGTFFGDAFDLMRDADTGDMVVAGRDTEGFYGVFRFTNLPTEPACRSKVELLFSPPPVHPEPIGRPAQLGIAAGQLFVLDSERGVVLARPLPLVGRLPLKPVATGFVEPTGMVVVEANGAVTLAVTDAAGLHVVDMPADALQAGDALPIATAGPRLPLARTGHLAWADLDEARFVIAPLPAAGQVVLVDLALPEAEPMILAEGLDAPRCVESLPGAQIFVACRDMLGLISLRPPAHDLLIGIGHVPFQAIDTEGPFAGRANTADALPGYFFQTRNALFGGNLHLMIDHEAAWAAGYRALRVSLDGPAGERAITRPFVGLRWSPVSARFEEVTVEVSEPLPSGVVVADAYRVHPPEERWYAPDLAAVIDTKASDDGLNTLRLTFFDDGGRVAEVREAPLAIENARCTATLSLPHIGDVEPELQCGCLRYGDKADRLELPLVAHHPRGRAGYQLSLYRGSQRLRELPITGPATDDLTVQRRTQTDADHEMIVRDVLGRCNVAHVSARLWVSSVGYVTNGFKWLSRGAYQHRSFTLVPHDLELDEG